MDELHLLLRVFDILMRNLIWAVSQRDHTPTTDSTDHIELLQAEIRQCGVTFKVCLM